MKNQWKIILFGIFIWLIPFLVSFAIYPLKTAGNPLFETIMPVIISIVTTIFMTLYFRGLTGSFLRHGMISGISWFFISIIIDLPLFLFGGPMKMTFADYMMDIGLTYLIIPVITIGAGFILHKKAS
jgi:hypothetical protein